MGNEFVVNVAMADTVLVPGEFMWTPLFFAVNSPCGDPHKLVKLLLDNGADVSQYDEAGCTVLYYAIANGYTETVKLLLSAEPTLQTSHTTDRMLMSLGAHHFIVNDNDIQRLSQARMHPDVIEALLCFEDDVDFVLLLWAIVDGKMRGEPLRPDDDLERASSQPRLHHLRTRTIVTEAQQELVDDFVQEHSIRANRESRSRLCLQVIQHKLFKLSVQRHMQALHADGWVREARSRTPMETEPSPMYRRMLAAREGHMAAFRSPNLRHKSPGNSVGSADTPSVLSPMLAAAEAKRRQSSTSLSRSQQQLVSFMPGMGHDAHGPFADSMPDAADDAPPAMPPPSLHAFAEAKRLSSVAGGASPAASAHQRRRSSIALSVHGDSDVLLTPRELVQQRRRYSVSTVKSPHARPARPRVGSIGTGTWSANADGKRGSVSMQSPTTGRHLAEWSTHQ